MWSVGGEVPQDNLTCRPLGATKVERCMMSTSDLHGTHGNGTKLNQVPMQFGSSRPRGLDKGLAWAEGRV
jgi:hypothetical protein